MFCLLKDLYAKRLDEYQVHVLQWHMAGGDEILYNDL